MKQLAVGVLVAWFGVVNLRAEGRTFAAIAEAKMAEHAKLAAEVFAKMGLMPPERTEALEMTDLRREVTPSSEIAGVVCDYRFIGGRLVTLHRRDLMTVTNGYAPIMAHKTNSVLALTKDQAEAKAFEILKALGFDEKELRTEWNVRVEMDLLNESLLGPLPRSTFPTFVSSVSNKIIVRLKKHGDRDQLGGLELAFLGTTGELLSMGLWDDRLVKRSGPLAEKIIIESAADFNPPLFFSAVREFKSRKRTKAEVAAFANEVWNEMAEKVGARKPALYVVFADIAHPEVVGAEISKRAAGVPWTGTAEDPHRRIRKQGLAVVAMCGRLDAQIEIVPEVRDARAWGAGVEQAVKKLGVSEDPPPHALLVLGPFGEPAKRLQDELKSDHRVLPMGMMRSGAIYFNGVPRRDAQVLLRATGMHREGENWTGVPIELRRYERLRDVASELGLLVGRLRIATFSASAD